MMGPIYSKLSNTVLEIGHRMGFGFFIVGIGTLISSPIQGALLGKNPMTYTWWKPLVFSVLCLVVGTCFLAVSRLLLIKRTEATKSSWACEDIVESRDMTGSWRSTISQISLRHLCYVGTRL